MDKVWIYTKLILKYKNDKTHTQFNPKFTNQRQNNEIEQK